MQFKKLVAGALGALMVGATASLAATLADYPAPFAANGTLSSVIVVGAKAQPADVVGAINLGARLAGESYTLGTAGTVTGTVSGGSIYSKDVAFDTTLGTSGNFKTPLKTADVSALKSGSLTFNSNSYNYEESFAVASTGQTLQIETSASTGGNKDMKDQPYLRYGLGDLVYNWSTTTALNASLVTSSKPLTVTILGKTFKITSFDAAKFTAQIAQEQFLKTNESMTVGTQKVTVKTVGTGSAVVDVDGTSKNIATGVTDTVNGLQVYVKDVLSLTSDQVNSGATVQAGADISKTYSTGDAFPGENKDNPNWVWNLAGIANSSQVQQFQVKFNKNVNLLTDTPAPLSAGTSLSLPNNYLKFGFDSITTRNTASYKIEYVSAVDLSNAGTGYSTSAAVIKISTAQQDGFTTVGTSAKTKTVYVTIVNSTNDYVNVSYVDSNNKVIADANGTANTTKIATLNFQDTNFAVFVNPIKNQINITETAPVAGNNITISTNTTSGAYTGFGTVNSAEAADVMFNMTTLGTRDEDTMTTYGTVIRAPKSNAGSDRVVLDVPSTQLKGFVSLSAGTGSTTTTPGTTRVVSPVKSAIAKLDKDAATDVTTKNVILVGGPCANDLVQQLGQNGKLVRASANNSNLDCSGWVGMKQNFGVIAVINDAFAPGKAALVVAGTRAEDTTLGTQIVQSYDNFAAQLKGNYVEYTGTDVSTVTFA